MPGFNGTGPMGQGARTGRGFGYCAPGIGSAPYQGIYGVGRGGYPRGGGRGRAWGAGRGSGWNAFGAPYPPSANPYPPAPADELSFLKEQSTGLQSELESIRKRMEELESAGKKSEEQS